MNLEKFKNENIAISFETEEEMKEFLKKCEKNNINWNGKSATKFIPFETYKETALTYNFGKCNHLEYSPTEFYKEKGWKVIQYKDFKKNSYNIIYDEIKNIAVNKDTTIIFWNDGTKTLVKKGEGQDNSPELAILYAYFQKHSGLSKTKANKTIQELVNNIQVQNTKAISKSKRIKRK